MIFTVFTKIRKNATRIEEVVELAYNFLFQSLFSYFCSELLPFIAPVFEYKK
jgi:hypothetical protein